MTNTLPPAHLRRFEDYRIGAVYDIGTFCLAEADIVEFASRYDPQAMHTDPVWAASGPFGGLIASGWHTIAATMRLIVLNFLPANGLVSPGIDELRWLLPVRPGEVMTVRATILDARRSRSRRDRGLIHGHVEVLSPAGEPALSMKPKNFIPCRESLASPD
jgi:acyl dehydratase